MPFQVSKPCINKMRNYDIAKSSQKFKRWERLGSEPLQALVVLDSVLIMDIDRRRCVAGEEEGGNV